VKYAKRRRSSICRFVGRHVTQKPSPEQYLRLEQAGHLQLFGSPEWLRATNGRVTLKFDLPRRGVSLLKLSWVSPE